MLTYTIRHIHSFDAFARYFHFICEWNLFWVFKMQDIKKYEYIWWNCTFSAATKNVIMIEIKLVSLWPLLLSNNYSGGKKKCHVHTQPIFDLNYSLVLLNLRLNEVWCNLKHRKYLHLMRQQRKNLNFFVYFSFQKALSWIN